MLAAVWMEKLVCRSPNNCCILCDHILYILYMHGAQGGGGGEGDPNDFEAPLTFLLERQEGYNLNISTDIIHT